ncbi:PREDICTED: protein MULTIPLE CHLOROPLAST DIVISION SITE 1 isoform X1 [Nicotiana attenuata]|uniref:protein MULTIPLE CHLOROPLAST DIVISION SITE 1 isoform X1 n=1 Tax=Nicotiana attenuata TaxID=49451 RepID=UPI0009047744|nr:PREDICTED: protein MULTIPLE CHLOROPLAST DIVISION SITE 1 isoform X1 [Nicotiana attenuata]
MAASIWTLQLHTVSVPLRIPPKAVDFRTDDLFNYAFRRCTRKRTFKNIDVVASGDSFTNGDGKNAKNLSDQVMVVKSEKRSLPVLLQDTVTKLQESVKSLPPPTLLQVKKHSGVSLAIGLSTVVILLVIMMRSYVAKSSRPKRPGSVADLVRRGQLRSDRRGISNPLKYDDPFNNPLVKISKNNSSVEMCGKVYRLAPVTLTKEQQAVHQKRRSRAYQWKRPTLFLKEGDSVPPDVDPDSIRWIPANHPFATTASEIDEDLAQTNVYQKHGVPFRIQAEHEALQRKLEALQSEQKLGELVIDPGAAKDFERPFKTRLKSEEQAEQGPNNRQIGSKFSESESARDSFVNKRSSEEMEKP